MVAGRELTPKDAASTERLMKYWSEGEGAAKWINSPHPYTTLYEHLVKYVSPSVAHGLAANIFKRATGEYPSQRAKGQRL